MKTNNVVIENVRRLNTEGPEAGTWSLSVSPTGLTFVGKKNNGGKKGEKNEQRAKTRHAKNSVSSLDQICHRHVISQ